MAHSRVMKERALELYVQGANREQIAGKLGVSSATTMRWYDLNIPRNWDEERKLVEDRSRQIVTERLIQAKAQLGVSHMESLQLAAKHWKRCFMVRNPAQADPEAPDGWIEREDMTPAEMRQLADAFSKIQGGQRIIFGENAYTVGVNVAAASHAEVEDPVLLAIEAGLAGGNAIGAEDDEDVYGPGVARGGDDADEVDGDEVPSPPPPPPPAKPKRRAATVAGIPSVRKRDLKPRKRGPRGKGKANP